MRSQLVWNLIVRSLRQNIPVELLYVVHSEGSSPGRRGFCMAVNLAGEMEGSVGGGIMEHKFVTLALERLKKNETLSVVKRQLHSKNESADRSGMICSGEQTLLLYRLRPGDLPAAEAMLAAAANFAKGWLTIRPTGLHFDYQPASFINAGFVLNAENDWYYTELTGPAQVLHIIGGGHCGLALSRLMRQLDFYVHIYDDRPLLPTMLSNTDAHEQHLLPHYEELKNLLEANENDYVVVMTFGYRTDDIVMRALWGKKFRYTGLLGSRSKIKQMMDSYGEEGMDLHWLASVRAPAGMAIRSQTPEEIAVSIAAEIIAVKNEQPLPHQ